MVKAGKLKRKGRGGFRKRVRSPTVREGSLTNWPSVTVGLLTLFCLLLLMLRRQLDDRKHGALRIANRGEAAYVLDVHWRHE